MIAVSRLELSGRERPYMHVADIADRDRSLAIGEEEDVAAVSRPAFARVGRAVVADRADALSAGVDHRPPRDFARRAR